MRPTHAWGALFAITLTLTSARAEVDFNRDVRPILSDRCYACHGPDRNNRKTKMRLDIEADAKADLGKGRFAVVAGDPEKSEIYKRIVSTSKTLRMPPGYLGHEPLKAREIEVIRQWIAEGGKYQQHWSFIPPVRPAVPDAGKTWAKNPIDHFVLARLAKEGLKPSPEADRRTLIRRVTLDLTGLPPTPAEVEAFVNDASPDAWEKVVDRLLASTRYAERMAIRWLEAARYADTNGYQSDGPRTMWRWRDWVIDAFHKDMPWDQFTIEQIAGDLLPNATLAQKIASGFQRNNRTSAEGGSIDEELRVEYVADRTETTGAVWMGLTIGCARCHDHKFDPISQKDYYSLYAFYNNVPERGFVWNYGNEDPVMKAPSPEQAARLAELDRRVAEARAAVDRLMPAVARAQRAWEKRQTKPVEWTVTKDRGLAELREARQFDGKDFVELPADQGPKFNYTDPFTFAAWVKPDTKNGAILAKGEDNPEGRQHGLYVMDGKLRLHVTFRWSDLALRLETVDPLKIGEWQHVAVSYDGNRRAAGVHVYVDGAEQKVKVLLDQLLEPIQSKEPWRIGAGGGQRFTGSLRDVRVYTRPLDAAEVSVLALQQRVDEAAAVAPAKRTAAQNHLLRLAFLETAPPSEYRRASESLAAAQAEREKFYATIPETMVMAEAPNLREAHILKRGAYDAPGEKVSPAVPSVLPQLPGDAPRNRLSLAKWLVDRGNPLTARATVNRWWAMFFGTGLVKTVEDLGSQGEWPVNPDLLDWLAVEFMDSGWRAKHMMRLIVTSAAYRQSSKVTPDLQQRDPENRLLARGPRFRVAPEMVRDQALAISGLLVDKVGGPPVKPYQPPGLWQELAGGKGYVEDEGEGLWRRSIYSYWKRTIAPPMMVNFDSPTRETCVIRESRTNTPLQALNLMNDVTFVEAARKFAERIIHEARTGTPEARVNQAFRLALGRDARAPEQASALKALSRFETYYRTQPKDAETLLTQGKSPRDASIPAPELAAWTGVASLVLNLDETITKE